MADMWQQNSHAPTAPGLPPVVKGLLISTGIIFLLQLLGDRSAWQGLTLMFGLNRGAVLSGELWRFFTYMFLHGSFWHIFINMLMLGVFGREMEELLGPRRFAGLYLVCGILAGVGWVLISGGRPGFCIGASGAVFGIMGAFAAMFPARRITLLVLFIFPVNMTARTMAIGMGVITLVSLMGDDGNIAHAAHLGGGVAGYLYGRYRRQHASGWERPSQDERVNTRFRRRNIHLVDSDPPESPSEDDINALLEKIRREGLQSLTRHEREVLERASRG
jgi:membrane associated rhomboid family serine protease